MVFAFVQRKYTQSLYGSFPTPQIPYQCADVVYQTRKFPNISHFPPIPAGICF